MGESQYDSLLEGEMLEKANFKRSNLKLISLRRGAEIWTYKKMFLVFNPNNKYRRGVVRDVEQPNGCVKTIQIGGQDHYITTSSYPRIRTKRDLHNFLANVRNFNSLKEMNEVLDKLIEDMINDIFPRVL